MTTIDPRLEAEYNNRLKVPEHPAIMAGWKRDAAVFRETHSYRELGLPYGPSERQAMDVFWPGPDRDAPVAMFIHGGYWAALDRSWFSHLATGFLAHGVALAVPSYDLCPQVTLEALIDEIRDAAAFLIARHRRDIYACGHSAGGHLTAMLLATDWRARGTTAGVVSGGCAISGLFDLRPLIDTSINGPLGLDTDRARKLSPVDYQRPGKPLHAFVGEREGPEYMWQSRSIVDHWGGSFGILRDADHFTAIAPLADPRSALIDVIMTAIRSG